MAVQAISQTDVLVAQDKLVEGTSKSFTDGVCSGYLTYYNDYQSKPLTDQDVYAFIVRNIFGIRDTLNAGYCTGWIEALLEDRKMLN